MCGIAGIVRTGSRPLPEPVVLRRMASAIAHRGPDDAGALWGEDVQLAAVRLAIIDLDGGHQPVGGCAPGLAAVYNGELYDQAGLRAELDAAGHRLADRCDTTLIPHLYEHYGDAMVDRLTGMFAFALWDGGQRRLLLVRDRLGIKPLYYAQTADYLLFASEIKAILASGLVDRALDRDAVDDLFSLSYPCPPRTLFRGVVELRPGHLAVVRPGAPIEAPRRWWRAPFPRRGEHRRGRRRALEADLAGLLGEVTAAHLVADVPVATYLSGGLDSSLIAALAGRAAGSPPTTLSIGFDDPVYDESRHIQAMAAALGGPDHHITAGAAAAGKLTEMLWHLELPLQVPGAIGGLLLSEAARAHGLPVVLTGDGADEIFGGYDCFRTDRLRRGLSSRWLGWLRPFLYRRIFGWGGAPEGAADHWLAVQARPAAEVARAFGGVYPPWYEIWHLLDVDRAALLSPDGRAVRPCGEAPAGFAELVHGDAGAMHPLDAALALELETRLPAWILVISDRSAMASAVEARVPFLDHRVVERVAAMPPAFKMRRLTEKAGLRGAARGIVPEPIRRRRKQPFMTPIAGWFFSDPLPDEVAAALAPDALRDAGVFAPAVVARLLAELAAAPAHHIRRTRLELVLMLVLGVQLVHRLFVADFDPDRFRRFGLAREIG